MTRLQLFLVQALIVPHKSWNGQEERQSIRSKLAGAYLPWPWSSLNHCSTDRERKHFLSLHLSPKQCDSLYLHLFPEPKNTDVVAFNHHSLSFFTLLYCNRLTVEPTARSRALHHGFNSTRSQGLAGFNSNMAAGLSNSTKELGFFYMIWRPISNWKVFRYHLQRRIVIPSYFITAEVHNNWPFYEKGEAYCTDCSHAYETEVWR